MTKKNVRDPFKGQYLDAPEKETLENKIIRKIKERGKVKPKKKLLGGLLRLGAKQAMKKHRASGGRNIPEIRAQQPKRLSKKEAQNRSKDDLAFGLRANTKIQKLINALKFRKNK
tara:strand:+ start:398 stop:742 length:345 start_codon:yes stop_codon:yes gene_type:complete